MKSKKAAGKIIAFLMSLQVYYLKAAPLTAL
jgi:hypothetical protein